jgi:hypothetical protein
MTQNVRVKYIHMCSNDLNGPVVDCWKRVIVTIGNEFHC